MEVKTAACLYKLRCDQLCGVLMSLKLLESYWLVFYTQVKSLIFSKNGDFCVYSTQPYIDQLAIIYDMV